MILVLALPAAALAQDGGAVADPGNGAVADPGNVATKEKLATNEKPARRRAGKRRRPGGARLRRATLLTSFELRRKRLFLFGRSARVNFTLSGRRVSRVRLHVLDADDRSRLETIDLGEQTAGSHSIAFTGL
jgi:hypothetical protein